MCITFFRIASKEEKDCEFPFVLAFNRDEMTYRHSTEAQFLTQQGMDNIICGIDIQTNSTWLALNKLTGDVCFLTNFRNPNNYLQNKKYSSRGFLVIDWVQINDHSIKEKRFFTVEDYEKNLTSIETRGFNIIYGNVFTRKFKYYQYENNPTVQRKMSVPLVLQPGRVYGMSNGSLDEWDKVERGKPIFEQHFNEAHNSYSYLTTSKEIDRCLGSYSKDLFSLMRNEVKNFWRLPRGTGYRRYWEYMNSSIFVRNNFANICTVSTTTLIVHKSGRTWY